MKKPVKPVKPIEPDKTIVDKIILYQGEYPGKIGQYSDTAEIELVTHSSLYYSSSDNCGCSAEVMIYDFKTIPNPACETYKTALDKYEADLAKYKADLKEWNSSTLEKRKRLKEAQAALTALSKEVYNLQKELK